MAKTFILHWFDRTTEKVNGDSISQAFMMAGYGAGALRALDYWEEENPVHE